LNNSVAKWYDRKTARTRTNKLQHVCAYTSLAQHRHKSCKHRLCRCSGHCRPNHHHNCIIGCCHMLPTTTESPPTICLWHATCFYMFMSSGVGIGGENIRKGTGMGGYSFYYHLSVTSDYFQCHHWRVRLLVDYFQCYFKEWRNVTVDMKKKHGPW